MKDLASQESRLRGLFEEVRRLLDRATPLAEKLNRTVHSADALYRMFEAKPIELSQYNDLLDKSNVVMDKLAAILSGVKPLYAAISRDANALHDPLFGKIMGLADHLFWRGMLLIAFFLVGLLGVLLAYKRLSFRMSRERQKG